MWSWGVNDEGALGRPARSTNTQLLGAGVGTAGVPEDEPGRVALPAGPGDGAPARLSAGDSHTLCVTTGGAVFGWGAFRSSGGLFGFVPGAAASKTAPAPVRVFPPAAGPHAGERATQVASGADHALCCTAAGLVFSWGCAERGRLGRLPAAAADVPEKKLDAALKTRMLTPGRVELPGGARARGVAAGLFFSFALGAEGAAEGAPGGGAAAVWGWGLNNYGQLTLADDRGLNAHYAPQRLAAAERLPGGGLAAVAGGEHHALYLSRAGRLFAAGRPTYGRLGRADVDAASDAFVADLRPVDGLPDPAGPGGRVTAAAAGLATSGCTTADGAAFFWGYGTMNQLGKRDDEDEPLPRRMAPAPKALRGRPVTQLSFGGQHAALLADPGPGGDSEPAATNGGGKRRRAG